ncbi:MAG TPA: hypothetical protein V6D15_23490 [Oculatellaceae cyanobacterium]|jgi:hypothetical protein
MPPYSLLNPSIEQLVAEIVAVNHAWKEARDLFGKASPLAISLREIKTRLQMRLLRSYAPEQVYLELDTKVEQVNGELDPEAEAGEPLYGLLLRKPINGRRNAEHLPVRVANEVLSESELQLFTRV